MATKLTARISVLVTPEERDAFFDFCRHMKPRKSMSDVLAEYVRHRIATPKLPPVPADPGQSTKKRHTTDVDRHDAKGKKK